MAQGKKIRPAAWLGILAALVFSAQAGALAWELPPSSGTAHIEFEADRGQYMRSSGTLLLEGNVKITEKDRPGGLPERSLRGSIFEVNMSSGVAYSTAAILMQEGGSAVYGENGFYDWSARRGSMDNVNSRAGVWRILNAKHGDMEDGVYRYKSLNITSCDKEDEHYRIHLGRLKAVPDEYIFGTNAVFFIGKIPVFYFPVFYKPIGNDSETTTYIEPGYDSRGGNFLRTTTAYKPSRNLLTRLFLDYYQKTGWGTGAEAVYREPKSVDSDISGYRIHEAGSRLDRWGLNGKLWAVLDDGLTCRGCKGSLYYTQAYARLVSDPDFNNDYVHDSPFIISADKTVSAAVVRQSRTTTTRVSYIRNESATADRKDFVKTLESRPRFDFQTAPIAGRLPFLNMFTASLDSSQTNTTNFYMKTAEARWTAQKSLPLSKGISLFVSGFYDQTMILAPDNSSHTGTQANNGIGRYGTVSNMRKKLGSAYVDLSYSFTQRLSPNSWSVDSNSSDTGEELNMLSAKYYYRPSMLVYLQVNTGWDFRHLQPITMPQEQQVQPINAETGWKLSRKAYFFVRDVYKFGSKKTDGNQVFLAQLELGEHGGNAMSIGAANYISDPRTMMINQTAAWYPKNKTWHLEGGINWGVTDSTTEDKRTIIVPVKTITLVKDFHDFHTEFTFQSRPGKITGSAKACLRFNQPGQRIISDSESKSFGYPVR
ncbi:MAG: hypothetical protein WC421_01340 [Elusimicrobiales bacterium]